MLIDIISDLHLSHYRTGKNFNLLDFFRGLYSGHHVFSDILVIAGDVDIKIPDVLEFLTKIKEFGGYKYILYVPGNNELYMDEEDFSQFGSSYRKYNYLIRSVNSLSDQGIFALDGTFIEIEGYRFGGATMWYDGSYLKLKYTEEKAYKESLCRLSGACSVNNGYAVSERSTDLFAWQKQKMNKIVSKVDVFISHVGPIPEDDFLDPVYRSYDTNSFFAFDGREILKENKNLKVWISGHSHAVIDAYYYDTRFICNALGYPRENLSFRNKVKQFII